MLATEEAAPKRLLFVEAHDVGDGGGGAEKTADDVLGGLALLPEGRAELDGA